MRAPWSLRARTAVYPLSLQPAKVCRATGRRPCSPRSPFINHVDLEAMLRVHGPHPVCTVTKPRPSWRRPAAVLGRAWPRLAGWGKLALPKPDPPCCPGALLALISCSLADLASADEPPGDKVLYPLLGPLAPRPRPSPPTSACPLAPCPWARRWASSCCGSRARRARTASA